MNVLDEILEALNRIETALGKPEARHTTEVEDERTAPEPTKEVTDVQVRAVFTAKHKAGKKEALGKLLKQYGATKLSEVDPARYADLLQEVEKL